ncbi:hypothetical protein CL656_02590 [bacterium]|nr:hypothetical protein [bacterium]|tara:strand:- start:981 stop:2075 length:1095 start_codon:yes stop_codon:yes gene_type:complete
MNQILSLSDYNRTVLAFAPKKGHVIPTIHTPLDPKEYEERKQPHHLKARILEVVTLLHSLTKEPDLVAVECGRLKHSHPIGGNFLHRRIDVETIAQGSQQIIREGFESKYAYNKKTADSGQINTLRDRFPGSGLNIFTAKTVGNFQPQGENILTYGQEIDKIVEFIIDNFRNPLSTDSAIDEATLKINGLLDLSLRQEELERNIHALNEIVDQLNKSKGTNPVRTIVNGFQTWLDTTPTKRRNEYPSAPHFNGTFISGDTTNGFEVVPTITSIQANKGYRAALREMVFTKGPKEIGRYILGFQVPVGVQIDSNPQQVNGITRKHKFLKTLRGAIENNTLTCAEMEALLSVFSITESTGPCTVRM